MGMPALRHRWTSDDVRALIEASPTHWPRYELIGGELIVTPAPASVHQVAVQELLLLLAPYVEREGLGLTLMSPADLKLLPDSIIQPDVFVAPLAERESPDTVPGWHDVKALVLAVEVISPGSARADRVEKRDYYMAARVPDYWVVDLDARVVEWWSSARERPTVATSDLTWHPSGAREPLVVDLPTLFERTWSKTRRLRVR
jgi:Uma2 family endonuclease